MARARWAAAPVPAEVTVLVAGGIEPRLAMLLARRGVRTVAEARTFLSPALSDLLPPESLPGLGAVPAHSHRRI